MYEVGRVFGVEKEFSKCIVCVICSVRYGFGLGGVRLGWSFIVCFSLLWVIGNFC